MMQNPRYYSTMESLLYSHCINQQNTLEEIEKLYI